MRSVQRLPWPWARQPKDLRPWQRVAGLPHPHRHVAKRESLAWPLRPRTPHRPPSGRTRVEATRGGRAHAIELARQIVWRDARRRHVALCRVRERVVDVAQLGARLLSALGFGPGSIPGPRTITGTLIPASTVVPFAGGVTTSWGVPLSPTTITRVRAGSISSSNRPKFGSHIGLPNY